MKIRCIIVDDEELARRGLQELLSGNKHIELIKSCADGMQAIESINALKPNLVLLDVQMPGINGFEVVGSIKDPKPIVIFITAHDEFAIKAFEVNAVDYLLKPFSDERFDQALAKAIKAVHNQEKEQIAAVDQLVVQTKESLKGTTKLIPGLSDDQSLVFRSDGQIHKIAFEEIAFFEAFDYYVKIHVGEVFFLIRKSLKKLVERIPETVFLRVHKSFIVNRNMIKQFGKSVDGHFEVTLLDNRKIKVSRSYKTAVQEQLIQ